MTLLTFDIVDIWHCWHLTLLTFDIVDIWHCWHLTLLTFVIVDIWHCWHFTLLKFDIVDILHCWYLTNVSQNELICKWFEMYILGNLKKRTEWVNNMDLKRPIAMVHYWVWHAKCTWSSFFIVFFYYLDITININRLFCNFWPFDAITNFLTNHSIIEVLTIDEAWLLENFQVVKRCWNEAYWAKLGYCIQPGREDRSRTLHLCIAQIEIGPRTQPHSLGMGTLGSIWENLQNHCCGGK